MGGRWGGEGAQSHQAFHSKATLRQWCWEMGGGRRRMREPQVEQGEKRKGVSPSSQEVSPDQSRGLVLQAVGPLPAEAPGGTAG